MERIKKVKERLKNIPFKEILIQCILKNSDWLEDKNTSQLDSGINGIGKRITPPYTPLTKFIKSVKGQPFDRVTLKDEGDFHSSIQIKINTDSFEFIATDPKTTLLEQKYSIDILGLTVESLEEFKQEVLKEQLIERLRNYIFKD